MQPVVRYGHLSPTLRFREPMQERVALLKIDRFCCGAKLMQGNWPQTPENAGRREPSQVPFL